MIKFILQIIFILFIVQPTAYAEEDSFQQVVNYLFSGDPFVRSEGGYSVKIVNRGKCITEFVGEQTEIVYWNNVDVDSIFVENRYGFNSVILKGTEPVVEVFATNKISVKPHINRPKSHRFGYWYGGTYEFEILRNTYTSYSFVPSIDTSQDRIYRALNLLYRDHCSSSKRKSAF